MISKRQALRTMKLVRIFAMVLVIAAIILYFTVKEYALYPAVVGFVMIAIINLPLNIWLGFKRNKDRRRELEKFDAEQNK